MRPRSKWPFFLLAGAVFVFLGVGAALLWTHFKRAPSADAGGQKAANDIKALEKKNLRLERELKALAPKGLYIVVDTASNVLYLKRGDDCVLTAVVSSGSGNVLDEPGGKRKWVFDTPRGEFKVSSKLLNPDWIKPDWAFVEEGEAPPKDWASRVEPGVLGDYAMGFGNGYFIHGTLYTRLLGRNVTHGCVRVADAELEKVFKSVGVGTKIYIF